MSFAQNKREVIICQKALLFLCLCRARLCTMPEQFNRVRLQMRHGHRMPHTVGYLLALPGPHSIIAQNPIYIIPVTTLRNLITFNHRTTHTITFFFGYFSYIIVIMIYKHIHVFFSFSFFLF